MLKGSVREPQCREAYSSEPAAANRAYTHTHAHAYTSTHTKHLDPLMCAYVVHSMRLYFVPLIYKEMGGRLEYGLTLKIYYINI